jgi:RNA polymerase sporulation-specific sigma factor
MLDEELVKLYKGGDVQSFNLIYERYKNTVKYFARNLYLLGADNDDLLQEGMLGLVEAVNTYKEGESSFKTYANLCIKSKLYSAVKKYASKKSSPLNNSTSFYSLDSLGIFSDNPEDLVIEKESDNELKNKIAKCLSSYEISVLNLYLSGLSYEEIALKLQKNVKAIDNALQRARKKIIKAFGE